MQHRWCTCRAVRECGLPGQRCCGEEDAERFPCASRTNAEVSGQMNGCIPTAGASLCGPCGAAGSQCCQGGTCVGSACNPDTNVCTVDCGYEGLPCCTGRTCEGATIDCTGGSYLCAEASTGSAPALLPPLPPPLPRPPLAFR